MMISEAAKVIQDFQHSIKDLRPEGIVQTNNNLPHLSSKIKQALLVFGEEMVQTGEMNKEVLELLMESYGIIGELFVEDPDAINKRFREYITGLKKGVIIDFNMPNPFGNPEQVLEYANFIEEKLNKLGKPSLLFGESSDPLGTYIYCAVGEKSRAEKDTKVLLDLASSRLTRAIPY